MIYTQFCTFFFLFSLFPSYPPSLLSSFSIFLFYYVFSKAIYNLENAETETSSTGRVAQSAEHRANNARVVSSSLTVTIYLLFLFLIFSTVEKEHQGNTYKVSHIYFHIPVNI